MPSEETRPGEPRPLDIAIELTRLRSKLDDLRAGYAAGSSNPEDMATGHEMISIIEALIGKLEVLAIGEVQPDLAAG